MRYEVKPSRRENDPYPFHVIDTKRVVIVKYAKTREEADAETTRRNGLNNKPRRA